MLRFWKVALLSTLLVGCRRATPPAAHDAGAEHADDAGPATPDAALTDAGLGPPYSSVSGGFRVRFPAGKAPEVEAKAIAGSSSASHLFKVQYGTSGYIVAYDDLAKGSKREPQQILDGAREGVLETTGGTIERDDPFTIDGFSGIDLTVTAVTSGITMRQRARVILVDGRLYQLVVVAPSWSGATAVEQDFFDSFELLRDAGP